MKTPSEIYTNSKREMPEKLGHWDYPAHFAVRSVSNNGGIRCNHKRVPASQTLTKEYIGFEEIARIKDIIDRVPTTPMSSCHKKHNFNGCQNITIAADNSLS